MINLKMTYRLNGGDLHTIIKSFDGGSELKILVGDKHLGLFDIAHLDCIALEATPKEQGQ